MYKKMDNLVVNFLFNRKYQIFPPTNEFTDGIEFFLSFKLLTFLKVQIVA